MTSPAQLQYLNAMGIPVWVSRELVIDEEPDKASANATTKESNQTAIDNPVAKSANVSGASNAVENILQDLVQNTGTPKVTENNILNQAPNEATKQVTETLVSEPKVSENVQTSIPNILAKTAQHTVYAEGSLEAEWVVIGQNPEFIEHEHGQPYSREEGVLLENMFRAVGIANPRNDAYLVNVLRNSQQNDADAAKSKAELNAIFQDCIKQVQPKVIVIVGQLAAQNVLHSDEPLARLRGKSYTLPDSNTHLVVSYYPSYLLSQPMDKRKAWDDLKLAMSLIAE